MQGSDGRKARKQGKQDVEDLTKAQFLALQTAFKKGGAAYATTRKIGGAYHRMLERLVEKALLNGTPPFQITLKGMRALHAACEARYRKSPCIAYLDDLQEVRRDLAK